MTWSWVEHRGELDWKPRHDVHGSYLIGLRGSALRLSTRRDWGRVDLLRILFSMLQEESAELAA